MASVLVDLKLQSIALSRFDETREYNYVVSPFSRLYLITEGEGWIMINGEKITLEPGFLYLIPSFTPCSYHFEKDLLHYYAHFSTAMLNGLNAYYLYKVNRKIPSIHLDYLLFERLLNINPDIELPHPDPDIYQTREWMYKPNSHNQISYTMETKGILEQLLSRFIIEENTTSGNLIVRYNIKEILEYIQTNLKESISIDTLAGMACLSNDHFSKVFKSIISISPNEYIITKRIEKAQFLLLTSDMPLKDIFEESGFNSMAHFSRIFKKYTSKTPLEYRRQNK